MPTPIAELLVTVGADVTGAVGGINSLNSSVASLSDRFDRARLASAAFAAAGAGIFAGLASSVKVAGDFENQMAAVRSVLSNADADQFGASLDNLALKIGRSSSFTSREVGSAIEELVKAGIPVQDIMNGAAAGVTNLAAATSTGTTQAATIAAQAMNQFGKSGSEVTAIVDKLTGVANNSASDITFLQQALAAGGGVAAGYGQTLEDFLDIVGAISPRFNSGSDAGTSFKAFLNGMINPSKAASNQLKALNLVNADGTRKFFDANGSIKTGAQLAGVLETALHGLNDAEREKALVTIFGTDGQRAANALYEVGRKNLEAFTQTTGEGGLAADSAAKRLNSLPGALNSLGGSLETVQIILGNFFLPVLKDIANAVKGPLDAFSEMSPSAQAGATALLGIAASALSAIGGFGLFGGLLIKFGPSLKALGGLLVSLSPVILAVAAVAGILAAAWQADLGGIQGIVSRAFERVPDLLEFVSGRIEDAINFWGQVIVPGIEDFALRAADALGPAFEGIGNFLTTQVGPKIQEFAGNVLPLLVTGATAVRDFWDTQLTPAFDRVRGVLADALGTAITTFSNQVLPLLVAGATSIRDFWRDELVPVLQSPVEPMDKAATAYELAVGRIRAASAGGVGAEGSGIRAFFDGLGQVGEKLAPFIAASAAFTNFTNAVNTLGGAIGKFIAGQIPEFFAQFSAAGDAAPAINILGTAFAVLSRGVSGLADFFNNAAAGIRNLAKAFDESQNIADLANKFLPSGRTTVGPNSATPEAATGVASVAEALANFGKFLNTPNGGQPLPDTGLGSQFQKTAFVPGGGRVDEGAITVTFNGPVSLSNGIDLEQLTAAVAAGAREAASRIIAPVPAGQPGLVGELI